jgi:di/tricarboxylate transporter
VRQALRAVDHQIILLGAAALALELTLRTTGGAAYLAEGLATGLMDWGVPAVLSGLFLVVALIGQFMSNNASSVLFTPIAVNIAHQLGVDPLPFIVAVIFASSASFATPVGYVTNLLVMTPGRYTFLDFLRFGGPLTLLVWLAFSLFAPWYYGLW